MHWKINIKEHPVNYTIESEEKGVLCFALGPTFNHVQIIYETKDYKYATHSLILIMQAVTI